MKEALGGENARCQNDTQREEHLSASKKVGSGFFMSSSQDNHGGIMHASKMNACTTKDRNVVEGQNGPPPDSPKAAAEKAGFEEGNPGYEMRDNARGQNDPVQKSNETAKTSASTLLQMLVFYH
jgi:hypothetical protein